MSKNLEIEKLRQFPSDDVFIATLAAEDTIADAFTLPVHKGQEIATIQKILRQAEDPTEQNNLADWIRANYAGCSPKAAEQAHTQLSSDPRVDYRIFVQLQPIRISNQYILQELTNQLHQFLNLSPEEQHPQALRIADRRNQEIDFAAKAIALKVG